MPFRHLAYHTKCRLRRHIEPCAEPIAAEIHYAARAAERDEMRELRAPHCRRRHMMAAELPPHARELDADGHAAAERCR